MKNACYNNNNYLKWVCPQTHTEVKPHEWVRQKIKHSKLSPFSMILSQKISCGIFVWGIYIYDLWWYVTQSAKRGFYIWLFCGAFLERERTINIMMKQCALRYNNYCGASSDTCDHKHNKSPSCSGHGKGV